MLYKSCLFLLHFRHHVRLLLEHHCFLSIIRLFLLLITLGISFFKLFFFNWVNKLLEVGQDDLQLLISFGLRNHHTKKILSQSPSNIINTLDICQVLTYDELQLQGSIHNTDIKQLFSEFWLLSLHPDDQFKALFQYSRHQLDC
jgi:hypothetical protein